MILNVIQISVIGFSNNVTALVFFLNTVIGDEASFAMNSAVNKWNVREWTPKWQEFKVLKFFFLFMKEMIREKSLCGKVYVKMELCWDHAFSMETLMTVIIYKW